MIIAGPTAVGKTAMAIELAHHYNTFILSADSRQFYKQLNIGSAKPSSKQLAQIKHYFIDTKNVGELYGAGHYEKDAIEVLNELFTNHQIVIMVGGSGLYINAVTEGVDDYEAVPTAIRENLNEEVKKNGLEWLQNELKKHDPVYFEKVDKNNTQRLVRAMEVVRHTKKPFSSFMKHEPMQRNFTSVGILLNDDRKALYQKIEQRVDEMMREGLLEEAKGLYEYKDFNALKTVGYRELFDYMDGYYSLEEAVKLIKQHTRNYAKRQLTWFKNKTQFEEFAPSDIEKIKAYMDLICGHE